MAQGATTQEITFSLSAEVVRLLRELAASGIIASESDLVEAAVRKELRRARDEWLRGEMEAASRDRDFVRSLEETMAAFDAADAESARLIPEEI
jgi:Arc/MetJ-type ribon-helix-helix transcriptional regulator